MKANGQPALAYYSWDDDAGAYIPFALNVLTIRGEKVCDVTCFITRSIEDPDPAVLARMPEVAFDDGRLERAFKNFGVPEQLD